MVKVLVMLSVVVPDDQRGALTGAAAAMHGREFPGVPSSWVSDVRTALARRPTDVRDGDAPSRPADLDEPGGPDGRTGAERAYEDGLEYGSIED